MQPTVESQTRLRRLVWLLGALLAVTVALGGVHLARMADEVRESQSALETAKRDAADARRDMADARRAAEAAEKVTREAGAEAQAAAAQREEIAAKLKAAETARAEAEAKLKAATEKLNGAQHE